ncbi:unc-112-related protein-like [Bombyx mandarina]|uniref:PH domain-containing protein n=3 Tax=Bombyx TaxID=7090 RepID=A0A8R2AEI1_BOMMO|nr:unc-112-related protein [Bombyx mori]XP_028034707.1 unc-112-related protein-like [Bombyx mandarina]
MLADGEIVGDGSWNLTIYVTDLNEKRTMVVKGDMHIGGVMLKLTESFGKEFKKDWSDHALWWPTRNKWLSRPKHTLDQYGVHADAALHFTPMHKPLRIQLPDLRFIDCKIDFSIDTFSAVIQLCKNLGIRHSEELSLCYPLEASHLKQNYQNLKEAKRIKNTQAPDTNTFIAATRGSSNSLDRSNGPCPATPPPPRSLSATPVASQQNGTLRRYGHHIYSTQSDGSSDGGYCGTPPRAASMDALDSLAELSLADSPIEPDSQSRESLLSPKSLLERARMNVGWLDSSLSIMEQYVREWDTLQLRFKFYSFFDLTPRAQDAPRLNQLYQQARWQILNQEVNCTEEEMMLFAALQLQIELQTLAGGSAEAADGYGASAGNASAPEDEIDAALCELQAQLEGGPPARQDITHVPELAGYLKYLRPKRFTLKAYKRGWISCRDGVLRIHGSQEAAARGEPPSCAVELRGAEVTPDAHPASGRYSIKLEVPSEDSMHEMWLKCENEDQYAEWVAACRLGSRGRSLADAQFASEAGSVRALLALQRPRPAAALSAHALPHNLQPENYLAPRYLKKLKSKFTQRLLESHANVKDLPLLEAKLQYIKTWQNLADYGQTLFVVRFMGHKKDEIIGIANNRIMRLDPHTGDHIKTWRFSNMKAWNVNWEIKHMMVQFEEDNIIFSVQSADCKVVHEFIGGYIFLSMRSKDANQTLDVELFHKLTGGWT